LASWLAAVSRFQPHQILQFSPTASGHSPYFTFTMKRLLLAFLLLAVALRASPETDTLIRLTREFDTAVASENRAALSALLHADYAYTGPELPPLPPTGPPMPVVDRRLFLLGGESTDLVARVVGPTAIVTGAYTVNQRLTYPRFLSRGRFTSTWVRDGTRWLLIAEHRSLNDVLEWAPSAAEQPRAAATPPAAVATAHQTPSASAPFASTDNTKKTGREETHSRHGHLPRTITRLFRTYEPTQLGYTKDQGDDPFLDFKFSAMFALHPGASDYPDPVRRSTREPFLRDIGYTGPNFYFAGTIRAGQYLGTRPSSPVVGKRFNPLLAVRFWATEKNSDYGLGRSRRESEDNFLEFVYGHESNGQFIASPGRFDDQLRVYLNQARDAATPAASVLARSTAYLAARDNISRGWDYVGVQFARDWDTDFFQSWAPEATIAMRAKFNYFLRKGLLQGDTEEYQLVLGILAHRPQPRPRRQSPQIRRRPLLPFHAHRRPAAQTRRTLRLGENPPLRASLRRHLQHRLRPTLPLQHRQSRSRPQHLRAPAHDVVSLRLQQRPHRLLPPGPQLRPESLFLEFLNGPAVSQPPTPFFVAAGVNEPTHTRPKHL
jgi:hypothetical protein